MKFTFTTFKDIVMLDLWQTFVQAALDQASKTMGDDIIFKMGSGE